MNKSIHQSKRFCECTVCGALFSSVRTFDKHRVGSFEPPARRCLSPDEMMAHRLELRSGRWYAQPTAAQLAFYASKVAI